MNKKFKKIIIFSLLRSMLILSLVGIFPVFPVREASAAYGISSAIRQAKSVDSPTVYYLDQNLGRKKAYVNEAAYLAYGNDWSEVKIVNQSELDQWPELRLVKIASNPTVYYIKDGKKTAIISAEDFLAFGFSWSEIATVNEVDLAQYRTSTYEEIGLGAPVAGKAVFVSLDASSPSDYFVPTGTRNNLLAVFSLKSGSEAVVIKKITFTLNGVFNPVSIENICLANEGGTAYDVPSSIDGRKVVFDFTSNPISVSPGRERKIRLLVDFESGDNYVGYELYASIDKIGDIISDGAARGAFPVSGAKIKFASSAGVLPVLKAEEQALASNEAVIGSSGQIIYKFRLSETSGLDGVTIAEISLVNKGTAGVSEINNFKLKDGKGKVLAVASQFADGGRKLIFTLNNYQLAKKSDETFTVTADIVSGDGLIASFDLDNVKAKGANIAYGLSPEYSNLSSLITLKRQYLGVSSRELTASKSVFSKQSGVIVGNFEIRNSNRKIKVDSLEFRLEKSASAPELEGNVYLVNYDTGEIYASFRAANLVSGAVNVALNSYELKSGETIKIALVADIPSAAKNGDTYRFYLVKAVYFGDNNILYSDAVNAAGVQLAVNRSRVFIYPNNEAGEVSLTKGQKNVKIASFIAEAASGEDALISRVELVNADNTGVLSYDNGFSNLKVKIGYRSAGNTIASPVAGTYAFEGFSYRLKAGERAEISVYADTDRDLKTSEIRLAVSSITVAGYKSGFSTALSGINVSSLKTSFGQVKAELRDVAPGEIKSNAKDNTVAAFKIKNTGAEDLRLESIIVSTSADGFSYSLGYSNLEIRNAGTGKTVSNVRKPVAGANKASLGNYKLAAGQELELKLLVDTSSAVSASNLEVYLSNLIAEGYSSKIAAEISGDPSGEFSIASTISAPGLIKPVSGSITYGFKDSDYPFGGEHLGIDIAVAQGASVKAAADGLVTAVVDGGATGYSYVEITHAGGLKTVYGHLSAINVSSGESVEQGGIIGLSGGAPGTPGAGSNTNGPHLHFEVWLNGVAVDPEDYF